MRVRSAATTANVVIGVIVLLAIVVGAVAVLRMDTLGERSSGPKRNIDPALVLYQQTAELPLEMKEVRAVAVGPEQRIFVAGDRAIHVLDGDGNRLSQIDPDAEPSCLAVGDQEHVFPGRVYAGLKDRVQVFDETGAPVATWDTLGEDALITSIATAEQDVFVADAGNRIVWRFDTSGDLKGRIGRRDPARRVPGFVITSPYFDLAATPDGLLHVVNPRGLRIEAYTFDGDLEFSWGKSSSSIGGFFGCCNPVHFAIFSDGRFVTAEKGVSRVKVYSPEGEFECVVAGPDQMTDTSVDVAVDAQDRVLLVDPKRRSVRIFERKKTGSPIEP